MSVTHTVSTTHTVLGPWATSSDAVPEGWTEANCSLIAAAPDLLAALREVDLECNCSSTGCDGLCTASKVRAAIAKAEGRS